MSVIKLWLISIMSYQDIIKGLYLSILINLINNLIRQDIWLS